MIRVSMSFACAALLAACTDGSGGDGPGPDAGMNEPLVNGVPASQYFGQFAWETTKTAVDGAAAFATAADGRNAYLVSFFLMPNRQLELFYAEGEGDVTATGWSLNVFGTSKTRRSGTWSIEGTQLVLDSFMRCDGFEFNSKPALRCTLSTSIVTPAAQGRAGTFKPRLSMSSPDDSEFADYVP